MTKTEKSTLPNYLYDIEGVENEADYNVEKTNRRFYFSYYISACWRRGFSIGIDGGATLL